MTDSLYIPNPEDIFSVVSPKNVEALQILSSGKIPDADIEDHKGADGQVFQYVSHGYVTRLLNNAFGQLWSTEVIETNLYDDNSASVVLKLHIDIPLSNGQFYRRTITEVGSHNIPGKSDRVPKADIVAGAASRALYRCVMRAFNIGLDLIQKPETPLRPGKAWETLKSIGIKSGQMTEEEVVEFMKSTGVKGDQILERYDDLYKSLMQEIDNRKMRKDGVE